MSTTRHVYVSGPRETYLDARTRELRSALLGQIARMGYEIAAFGTLEGGLGLAAGSTWSRSGAMAVMRRCVGAVLLGFPYWRSQRDGDDVGLVTEYCHYEGALAAMLDLPILALLESGTAERVAFNTHGGDPVLTIPRDATADWAEGEDFQRFLAGWRTRLERRRDVFLGYCSTSTAIARDVKAHLVANGVTVLDWIEDFELAQSILSAIQDAAARCSAGIFLFTKDDSLALSSGDEAVPRDNVLFESGYFTHAKGKERVLIVRETGVKMPADLGGDIYVPFVRDEVGDLLDGVTRFIRGTFGPRE